MSTIEKTVAHNNISAVAMPAKPRRGWCTSSNYTNGSIGEPVSHASISAVTMSTDTRRE